MQFQQAQKGLNTGLATGINALQGRRAGVAGIGGLINQYNQGITGAGVAAQKQQNAEFQQLGSAAGQQTADTRYALQQNAIAPFQKSLQYDYSRLGGANAVVNAGLSNITAGASTEALGITKALNPSAYQNMGLGYGGGSGYYGGYGGLNQGYQ